MDEQHKAHIYAWENFKTSRFVARAHQNALEIASATADPILKPTLFQQTYWIAMGGYGIRPYYPGCPLY